MAKTNKPIYPIDGIELASSTRNGKKNKLLLVKVSKNSNLFGCFTQNSSAAAPILVAKKHLYQHSSNLATSEKTMKALIINAGNANAATGKKGYETSKETCKIVAAKLGIKPNSVFPFSTGVIGKQLDISLFHNEIDFLASHLSTEAHSWEKASEAILTTDTQVKIVSEKIKLQGKNIHITGIAKGSGMICPNMATMLGFVATDAKLESFQMNQIFRQAVEKSFNRISVDGDTSTNDAAILITTNKKEISKDTSSSEFKTFKTALEGVFKKLARLIIKDAEGATKLIIIVVEKAKTKKLALQVAYDIANSPLVKTAFFAEDANWGRIIAAIGKPNMIESKAKEIDLNKIELYLNDAAVFQFGEIAADFNEKKMAKIMKNKTITIRVVLNNGAYSEKILTNDLSYDYIKINATYRS